LRRPTIIEFLGRAPILVGNKVKLRPKRLQDAANDYSWRRDGELCRLDAALPISVSFEDYLESYAGELRYPRRGYCFAIETLDGRHIGNCSYFSIDDTKKEVELGIMIGDKTYWSQGYGADAILTLLNNIFSQTKLERVYLKTLKWNTRAHKCFQKCGFLPCGQLIQGEYNFILMEIHRAKLQNKTKGGKYQGT
jgi:ribosomal-protein-alanine N-acetyltransferase